MATSSKSFENNEFPTISSLLKVVRNAKTSKARIVFKMNDDNKATKSKAKAKNNLLDKKLSLNFLFNHPSASTAVSAPHPALPNLNLSPFKDTNDKDATSSNSFQFREINVKKAGRKPNGYGFPVPQSCPDCQKHKDLIKTWRFDTELQMHFCNTCFARRTRRQRMYIEEESGRMCVKCDRIRSNDWYRDKETSGDLCAACYMQSYNAKTRTDRTCNSCTTNTTRQWYKDKRDDGYICSICYKRRLKTDK